VFHYRKQDQHVKTLADFALKHYFPEQKSYAEMFREVVIRTAKLVAKWQSVGFEHGVLNTDNMSLLGLTIDYGPFAFLDEYDPSFICNHSDEEGRYSFENQPAIGKWNLERLADAFSSLITKEEAQEALNLYVPTFESHYLELMRSKLGFKEAHPEDQAILSDILSLMKARGVDYTIFWRKLADYEKNNLRSMFTPTESQFDDWIQLYQKRLAKESSDAVARKQRMNQVNPKYILRTYLAQNAIQKANQKDYSEVNKLLKILQHPFDEQPEHEEYAQLPPDWSKLICLSCSS
jgi:uncharacterized protein YdiU (UPF0061 family)